MATFTVTGHFEEGDGSAASGEVRFYRREYLFTDDGILAPAVFTATLNGTGDISKVLRSTNTAGDLPAGWSYYVEVELAGQEKQVGTMELTANTDLVDVMASWPEAA